MADRVADGEFVIGPERGGGPFDPIGVRPSDVYRADDVVAVSEVLGGRWLFVTLTLDRQPWLAGGLGAEAAYLRAQERVRKVAGLLSRVWVASIEPQTKTGEGWIHWHLLVYCPSSVPLAECVRLVERAWSIRECIAAEVVDRDSGEVLERARFARQSLGRVDVEVAGSRTGTAVYVAKYIVKPWAAVPEWMGRSCRKQRKFRLSVGFYEVLERLHRHSITRGSRKPAASGRRLRARPLFERMARSGSRCVVFQKVNHSLKFHSVLPVPIAQVSVAAVALLPLRLGHWGSVRYAADQAALERVREWCESPAGRGASDAWRRRRRVEFENAWDYVQGERERAESQEVGS